MLSSSTHNWQPLNLLDGDLPITARDSDGELFRTARDLGGDLDGDSAAVGLEFGGELSVIPCDLDGDSAAVDIDFSGELSVIPLEFGGDFGGELSRTNWLLDALEGELLRDDALGGVLG